MRAFISGTGSYLPERVMTNAEICERAPTTDEWIREKLGIEERRIAADDEQPSDLGANACRSAIENAGLQPDDIDGIICAIGTGDVIAPATAGYIQNKLGIGNKCFAFDVKMACAGTIGGLKLARGLIESGQCENVLVLGTYILSRTSIDYTNRTVAPIFGDGAGAAVVSATPDDERGILESRLHTDGSLTEIVGRYVGGAREMLTPEKLEANAHMLTMDGRAVWDCAMREVPAAIRAVLEARGLGVDDVDFVVAHQANKRLLTHILAEVGVPLDKTYFNVQRYGNTSAASALIALDEVNRKGLIKRGDLIVLAAIGAGMTWGAHLVRW